MRLATSVLRDEVDGDVHLVQAAFLNPKAAAAQSLVPARPTGALVVALDHSRPEVGGGCLIVCVRARAHIFMHAVIFTFIYICMKVCALKRELFALSPFLAA